MLTIEDLSRPKDVVARETERLKKRKHDLEMLRDYNIRRRDFAAKEAEKADKLIAEVNGMLALLGVS